MYYVIWELKKKQNKAKQLTKRKTTLQKNAQRNTQQRTYDRPKRRRRTGRLNRTGNRFHVFHELKCLKGIRKGKSVNWPTERASNQNISNRRTFGYPFFIYIFSYFETEVVGKSARDNPVRYCGWFCFKGIERPWTYVCKWKRKATKVGSTAAVSGTVYWSCAIWILPFGIVAGTYFPTTFLNMSQNSCI